MTKDIGARQELDQVIAALAFAVNEPGCQAAFTALAEWMETEGHTPREIAAAFKEHMRPRSFITPMDVVGPT